MNSHTTQSFREAFKALPLDVRKRAKQTYRLWRNNPQLPGFGLSRWVIKFRFALVANIVRLAFCRVTRFIGIGLANMMNMTNYLVDIDTEKYFGLLGQ